MNSSASLNNNTSIINIEKMYIYLYEQLTELKRLQQFPLKDLSTNDHIYLYHLTYHIITLLENIKPLTKSQETLQKINFLRNRLADNLDQLFSCHIDNNYFLSTNSFSAYSYAIGLYEEVMNLRRPSKYVEPFASPFYRNLKQLQHQDPVVLCKRIIYFIDRILTPFLSHSSTNDNLVFENAIKLALCELAISIRYFKEDFFATDSRILGEKINIASPSVLTELLFSGQQLNLNEYSIAKILSTVLEARNLMMHSSTTSINVTGEAIVKLATHLTTIRDQIQDCLDKYLAKKKTEESKRNYNSFSSNLNGLFNNNSYYSQVRMQFINQSQYRRKI